MHFRLANRKGCSLPISDSHWYAIPFAAAKAAANGLAVTIHLKWMEEEAGDGRVAAVDPVDSKDEEVEDEDEDNRTAVIRQYFH
ncbi:hypothetical protein NDU88_008056 [Pleurodeles waltl]|uniref:Uncharacterized protein n=1 Tax=Pleurodeles waltl TaxID=8319 RepID=A0AAV7PNN9_PLEWA|nr:hypothetical protein NDU88_008056 [Pleurodeles waltl]